MADVTTEAAADDEDGVNSPNTQKRLDFAAALKKDAPSPGVARRIIEQAGTLHFARFVNENSTGLHAGYYTCPWMSKMALGENCGPWRGSPSRPAGR